jgi:hypothetical protein
MTLIAALVALAWFLQPAQAQQPTRFKGKTFDLPTPAGYCIPDPGNEFAKRIAVLLKNSGDTVVRIAADCRQLKAGRNIYDYLAYYYVTNTESEILDGDVQAKRKALCDHDLRATAPGSIDIHDAMENSARELRQELPSNSTQYIGVLAEDAHGCIGGLLARLASGSERLIVNVDLLGTVVHGRSLFLALYSKYESAALSDEALARAKALAAELDARNPD